MRPDDCRWRQTLDPCAGPQDWNSGDRLWLIDMVAPWGGAEQAAKELTEQVFKGREMRTLRAKEAPVGAQSGAAAASPKAPA